MLRIWRFLKITPLVFFTFSLLWPSWYMLWPSWFVAIMVYAVAVMVYVVAVMVYVVAVMVYVVAVMVYVVAVMVYVVAIMVCGRHVTGPCVKTSNALKVKKKKKLVNEMVTIMTDCVTFS